MSGGVTAPAGPGQVGDVADGLVVRGWAVDPASGREGAAEIAVSDGTLERLTWLTGDDADGITPDGLLIAPGFVDLHAHFREPGNEDAETVATGVGAAAHGGFTTVCLMPNTTPAIDEPGVVARVRAAGAASGSPVRVLVHGAVTAGRAGETLAALGELADAGVIGFSDDGSPVRSAAVLRNALAYAGALGLPIIDHPEDPTLTEGAEASEGYVATVLGLKGWPVAAEAGSVARAIAILSGVVGEVPGARLHLTHVSTRAALDHVRVAKAAGLPVTCDVTPHHLGFTDEWIAGSRRWAWDALGADGTARDPWTDGSLTAPPFDPALRVNPPLRAPEDAAACLHALVDGTADAIATDHAPHTAVDKHVEFGWASNGISGIETAIGIVLAAVDAGRLPLLRAIEALTTGPAAIAGSAAGVPALREGEPADLVVIDRGRSWTVDPSSLRSRGKNTPLIGRELRGVVQLTLAAGRVAFAED
ncbi:MAG TPA: dihydroorotase [Candidatus Limnocylindrales bacterium]|jgi:dihydroorotase